MLVTVETRLFSFQTVQEKFAQIYIGILLQLSIIFWKKYRSSPDPEQEGARQPFVRVPPIKLSLAVSVCFQCLL